MCIRDSCNAGDHFICSSTVYGGTSNLFVVTMKKMGIEVTLVDPDAPAEEIEKEFRPNTKCVFGESLANPAMVVLLSLIHISWFWMRRR